MRRSSTCRSTPERRAAPLPERLTAAQIALCERARELATQVLMPGAAEIDGSVEYTWHNAALEEAGFLCTTVPRAAPGAAISTRCR